MDKQYRFIISGSILVLLTGCGLFSPAQDVDVSDDPVEMPEEPAESVEDMEEVAEERPEEEDPRNEVSFFAVGDNLIHSQIFNYAQTEDGTYDFKPIYMNFADDIQNADLAFINQESIIGGDNLGFSGFPTFNTPSNLEKINIPFLGDVSVPLPVRMEMKRLLSIV